MGRHSEYTPEKGDRICELIADGMSLRKVCAKAGMPDKNTVRRWLKANEDFRVQYAQARQDQADHWADEIIDLVDETTDPAKARLQLDARKWIACKLHPRAYGEKQQVELGGPDGGPLVVEIVKYADKTPS